MASEAKALYRSPGFPDGIGTDGKGRVTFTPRAWFARILPIRAGLSGFDPAHTAAPAAGILLKRWRVIESGAADPTIGELTRLSATLDVSLDYLVAALRAPIRPGQKSQLAYGAELTAERASAIVRGDGDPTLDELVALRSRLNVSLDFLVPGMGRLH